MDKIDGCDICQRTLQLLLKQGPLSFRLLMDRGFHPNVLRKHLNELIDVGLIRENRTGWKPGKKIFNYLTHEGREYTEKLILKNNLIQDLDSLSHQELVELQQMRNLLTTHGQLLDAICRELLQSDSQPIFSEMLNRFRELRELHQAK